VGGGARRLPEQLPRDFRYAVELRNPELLTDAHGAVLVRHGVAHVFNSWNEMPAIGAQLELALDVSRRVYRGAGTGLSSVTGGPEWSA